MPEDLHLVSHDQQNPGLADQASTEISSLAAEAPFLVEHHQEDQTARGYFRPTSRLVLTPSLRTGGLWAALSPEDFKNLLLMLTFLTPNGWCRPTLLELSEAMHTSPAKAKARMQRLTEIQWQEKPLVTQMPRPDGLEAFVPSRSLVAHEETPAEPPQSPKSTVSNREAVIAHSRARYATSRAEVERQIGELMGWGPPRFAGDDPAVAEGKQRAFKAMTDLGMPKEQALDLLARFDLMAVERQIAWLPSRSAKNPSRYLAAAIEGHYDMPVSLRRQALLDREILDGRIVDGKIVNGDTAAGGMETLERDKGDDEVMNTENTEVMNTEVVPHEIGTND